jgi:hypothetical protein
MVSYLLQSAINLRLICELDTRHLKRHKQYGVIFNIVFLIVTLLTHIVVLITHNEFIFKESFPYHI